MYIYIYLHWCVYKYMDVYRALMCVCVSAKTHKQCRVDIHSVSMHHRLRPWPIRSGCLEERARAGVGGILSMNWLDISRLNHGFDDRRYIEVPWLFFDDSMRELARSFGLKAGGTHELANSFHSDTIQKGSRTPVTIRVFGEWDAFLSAIRHLWKRYRSLKKQWINVD